MFPPWSIRSDFAPNVYLNTGTPGYGEGIERGGTAGEGGGAARTGGGGGRPYWGERGRYQEIRGNKQMEN